MSGSQTDEIAPQLFECFIDRAEADLPEFFPQETRGALVAGPDLLAALEDFPKSYEIWGYRKSTDGDAYERAAPQIKGTLEVLRHGDFWYIRRQLEDAEGGDKFQVLVFAFENVPICTNTFENAIRLAEHCHPEARAPMAGYWFTYNHS